MSMSMLSICLCNDQGRIQKFFDWRSSHQLVAVRKVTCIRWLHSRLFSDANWGLCDCAMSAVMVLYLLTTSWQKIVEGDFLTDAGASVPLAWIHPWHISICLPYEYVDNRNTIDIQIIVQTIYRSNIRRRSHTTPIHSADQYWPTESLVWKEQCRVKQSAGWLAGIASWAGSQSESIPG